MIDDRAEMSNDLTKPGDGGSAAEGGAWAWATEHGAPEQASTEQLVGWLARGELPPYTLVWRPGWAEWLPAMQVAELSAAFPSVTPGSRRVAGAARDASWTPPPVPVAHYPRLRLVAKDVVGPSTLAPFAGIVPAQAGRRALRDLDAAQQDLVTSQVPVAKMLEAARAMKRPRPPAPPGHLSDARDMPPIAPFGALSSPPGRTLSPHALELGSAPWVEPPIPPFRSSRRYGRWLLLGALAGGALGLFAVRGSRPDAAASATAVNTLSGALTATPAPEPNEARVVTGRCLTRNAVRLDEWAIREVPPMVAPLWRGVRVAEASPGSAAGVAAGRVAVSYAQSRERAVGLVLTPESLALERLVSRRALQPIFSVSPLVTDGELVFRAERAGAPVAHARTVIDVDPPLRIGMNAQGLVAGQLEAQAKRIWELPPGKVISVPAIASHPGGLTLATLLGLEPGPLRVGVLSARGEPLTELGQIGGSEARFGRPSLASGGGITALAVAARSRDGSRQSIWLSHADAGERPLVLQAFDPMPEEPIGGGAGELDTPAIAALPGGGFALLFTQGQGWKRRVRLSRLSPTLTPLDAPVDVTMPDRAFRGASVGALFWVNDRLLAFHFLGRDGGFSLWVSSIECELG